MTVAEILTSKGTRVATTRPDGSVPEGIEAQAEQTYANIKTALGLVGLGLQDVVRLTTYLTDAAFIDSFFRVRARAHHRQRLQAGIDPRHHRRARST